MNNLLDTRNFVRFIEEIVVYRRYRKNLKRKFDALIH